VQPRHALTGAVSVVGTGVLVWCAWLLLRADLTTGTTLAAGALWLLAAVAVATLVAFVREAERHRKAVGRRAAASSWKPLPGLVLLWVGGLTALVAFPFMLSGASSRGASAEADDKPVTPAGTTAGEPSKTRSKPTSASRSTGREPVPTRTATASADDTPSATGTSRTPTPRTTTQTSPTSTTTSPPRTSTTSTTSTPTATTTTNPGGITITLLPKPTKPQH
jgi:hypothetical protein